MYKAEFKVSFWAVLALLLPNAVCGGAQGGQIDLFADKAFGEAGSDVFSVFQCLRCMGNVEITTDDGFHAKGGEAYFYAPDHHFMQIDLTPESLQVYCSLSHKRGRMQTEKIHFDLENKQVVCEKPVGEIFSGWEKEASIAFQANRLIWQNDIVLDGDVHIEQDIRIHSPQIHISLEKSNCCHCGKANIGAPSLTEFPHSHSLLTCAGCITFDPVSKWLSTDQPIVFQDEHFQMKAGNGRLNYQSEDGLPLCKALYCSGFVTFILCKEMPSFKKMHGAGRESWPQPGQLQALMPEVVPPIASVGQKSLALAEEVAYFPESKTIILTSQSPNHVLLWQSDGTMAISAPEIRIQRDTDGQQVIHGIGDVHFQFSLEEQRRIETFFSSSSGLTGTY
jgi:hypothetical protein